MDLVFQAIDTRITSDMSDVLDKNFSNMEVKFALDQMNPNKAHGLNGMLACFYQ